MMAAGMKYMIERDGAIVAEDVEWTVVLGHVPALRANAAPSDPVSVGTTVVRPMRYRPANLQNYEAHGDPSGEVGKDGWWEWTIPAVDMALEDAKSAAIATVTQGACDRLEALVADYSPQERETWHEQIREAVAVLADPGASAPFIEARSTGRGVTKAELAERIISRRDQYRAVAGAILGHKDHLLASIEAAADLDALRAINLDAGWP